MAMVICPECDTELLIDKDTDEGYVFTCEECGTELQVFEIEPFAVRVYNPEAADYDDYHDDYSDDLDDGDDDDEDNDYGFDDDLDDGDGSRY